MNVQSSKNREYSKRNAKDHLVSMPLSCTSLFSVVEPWIFFKGDEALRSAWRISLHWFTGYYQVNYHNPNSSSKKTISILRLKSLALSLNQIKKTLALSKFYKLVIEQIEKEKEKLCES